MGEGEEEPPREAPPSPELLREIEVRDPETDPQPGGEDGAEGPYKNLLVPLVVVPAMIVMVAVLIAVLFGLLSGDAKSPRENLDRLLNGGVNERQQAAFELVRQILEFETARAQGRDPEWGIDESFLEDLRRERAALAEAGREEEMWEPFVLSSLMAQLGDPEGVRQLLESIRPGDARDPDFRFGQNAIFVLGSIGEELDEPLRLLAARRMIELLEEEDEGVVLLAAAALQNLPTPDTPAALSGLLGRHRLDLRVQAALSLAELGDAAGRGVLLEAVGREPYEAERASYPRRWAPQTVSETRRRVLLALDALGVAEDTELLHRLAEEDEDPNVRSLALELADRRSR